MKQVYIIAFILLALAACEGLLPEEEEKPVNISPECSIAFPLDSVYFFPDDTVRIQIEAFDEDGAIAEVQMKIDRVLVATFQSPPYEYVWTNPEKLSGEFKVEVIATDDEGARALAQLDLIILEEGTITEPPVAKFEVPHSVISLGYSVHLFSQSTNNPTSYFWDFGDGKTSDRMNPSFLYGKTGTFTIKLVVSNLFGSDTLIKENAITVIKEDLHDICYGCDTVKTVTDYDGNVYPTVEFRNKLWMGQNLKTTHLNDGTPIPMVADNDEWDNLTSPGYSWYDNDSATYHDTYGPLYNWYTVDTEKLCPAGWHVSTDDDWYDLDQFLGGQAVSGGKLKEKGFEHWLEPNTGASNTGGFRALPGGFRTPYGGSFYGIGIYGKYWQYDISRKDEPHTVFISQMEHTTAENFTYSYTRAGGMSVRCVMDKLYY